MNDKRSLLLQAAMTLFLSEGLSVPTAEIAKEARVANGTLFNYFPTKQELVDSLYLALNKEVATVLLSSIDQASDFLIQLKDVWDGYIHWAIENPSKHHAIRLLKSANVLSPNAHANATAEFRPMQTLAKQSIEKGQIVTPDFEYFEELISAQIDVTVAYALRGGIQGAVLERLLKISFEIFLCGVSRPSPFEKPKRQKKI